MAAYATLEHATARLKNHIGALIPGHLTRERVRAYQVVRQKEGFLVGPSGSSRRKPLSDGTLIRELVTLRAALRWAQRDGWITTVPHVETPATPAPCDRWLTRDEAARLLATCTTPHIRLFIILAYRPARAWAPCWSCAGTR